jgi:hypothetical protein
MRTKRQVVRKVKKMYSLTMRRLKSKRRWLPNNLKRVPQRKTKRFIRVRRRIRKAISIRIVQNIKRNIIRGSSSDELFN